MSNIQRFAVIMAGGAGERFWPLSRQSRPKQLLHLTDPNRSMLAEAVDRLIPITPRERIYVITSRSLVEPIRLANVGVPPENVVAEPCKRNTAGALLYISAHILAAHPELSPEDISLAIVTADHKIGAPENFVATLNAALSTAEREDALVICGILPDTPETGFGYIEAAAARDDGFHPVAAFHEKPNLAKAESFIAQGNHYWNSGMFFWRLSTFYAQFQQARPDLATIGHGMAAALKRGNAVEALELFESLEDISIDYALMERATNVLMVVADFPWRDVGLWSHLDHLLPPDENGNSTTGDPVLLDSTGCIVYNAPGAAQVAVGVAGVHDLVIAVTADAVLVIPKDRAQDVRHLVAELKKRNATQL